MKIYIGTKILNAKPMTRAAYNSFRGWPLPADENGADEGYLVEYADGGAPNTVQYAGYVSWSPKTQFEQAYLPIGDVSGMPSYQQRVVAEKVQLDAKIAVLSNFITCPLFSTLDRAEQARLVKQETAMKEYSDILSQRIATFGVLA